MRRIEDPMALARVRWRPASAGGRRTGPPPGPFYAATAVFVHGGDRELVPDWPAAGEHFSVLLEYLSPQAEGEVDAKVDFVARELVRDRVRPQVEFLVMEGRTPVADAVITEVLDAAAAPDARPSEGGGEDPR